MYFSLAKRKNSLLVNFLGVLLAKSVFGAGFLEGVLIGLAVKTGVDASSSGIALMVVNALKSGMSLSYFGVAVDLLVVGLVIGPWILLVQNIQENGLPFIIGGVIGFLLIFLVG